MPDSGRNQGYLSKSISSTSVALSGPVPWDLLKELTFNQGHPINRAIGGKTDILIKLPELINIMGQPEYKEKIDALENWGPARRADDIRKVGVNREFKLPVPPIVLFRTNAKELGESH
eukprot:1438318-Heterocapsa_arctica.AAC.1